MQLRQMQVASDSPTLGPHFAGLLFCPHLTKSGEKLYLCLGMIDSVLTKPTFTKSPRTRPIRAKAATQAFDLQELLYKAAHQEDIKPVVLAQVARAWCEVQDTKRVIQMKPAPKPIDVSGVNGKRQRRPGPGARSFVEPERPTPGPVSPPPDKPAA